MLNGPFSWSIICLQISSTRFSISSVAIESVWLIKTPTGGNSRFVAVTDTDVLVAGVIIMWYGIIYYGTAYFFRCCHKPVLSAFVLPVANSPISL